MTFLGIITFVVGTMLFVDGVEENSCFITMLGFVLMALGSIMFLI